MASVGTPMREGHQCAQGDNRRGIRRRRVTVQRVDDEGVVRMKGGVDSTEVGTVACERKDACSMKGNGRMDMVNEYDGVS